MNKGIAYAGLAVALVAAGPLAAAEDPGAKVVATVNGVSITQATIDSYAQQLQSLRPGQVSQDQLVNVVVDKELVYQDAEKTGLTKDPEVIARVETLRRELIVGEALDAYATAHPPTDEEVQKVYDQAVKSAAGDEYKARHILLKTQEEAEAVIVELDQGGDFAELAKAKSTGPSKTKGGDLGWFRARSMVPEFSAAVKELADGSYTKTPVQTQFGWHVILREESRPIAPPPLADVRPQIEQQLKRVKLQEYIEGLRSKADIKKP